MTGKHYLLAALCITAFLGAAKADTVKMKNGDALTGKVVSLEGGTVRLKTSYMGEVKITLAEVAAIVTDEPMSVVGKDGAGAVGRVEYEAGEGAAVIGPEGAAVVPEALIVSMRPANEKPPEPKWKGALEIGVAGQDGNRNTFSGNAKISLQREKGDVTTDVYASGRYAREEGETSANQQRAGIKVDDRLDGSPWYRYYSLDLFRDEFQDIDFRGTPSAGVGRVWWKSGDNWWKTGLGLGFTYEVYTGGGSDSYPIAEIRSDYGKRLAENLIFGDQMALTPDLSSLAGWRAENEAALSFIVNEHWRLKLGLTHRYENDPAPGVEALDTYYIVNAVRTF